MLKQVLAFVQGFAVLAAAGFVVLLFAAGDVVTNSPPAGAANALGAEVYGARCAGCHGTDLTGSSGPSLIGVADRYPDVADQIAVVADGQGSMPSFGSRLTAEEIEQVVAFTREGLGESAGEGYELGG